MTTLIHKPETHHHSNLSGRVLEGKDFKEVTCSPYRAGNKQILCVHYVTHATYHPANLDSGFHTSHWESVPHNCTTQKGGILTFVCVYNMYIVLVAYVCVYMCVCVCRPEADSCFSRLCLPHFWDCFSLTLELTGSVRPAVSVFQILLPPPPRCSCFQT